MKRIMILIAIMATAQMPTTHGITITVDNPTNSDARVIAYDRNPLKRSEGVVIKKLTNAVTIPAGKQKQITIPTQEMPHLSIGYTQKTDKGYPLALSVPLVSETTITVPEPTYSAIVTTSSETMSTDQTE